jgi:RNA recognition motif-containing protein
MMRFEDTLENNNLYVRNIPYTVTEEDLKKLFGQFGNISQFRIAIFVLVEMQFPQP